MNSESTALSEDDVTPTCSITSQTDKASSTEPGNGTPQAERVGLRDLLNELKGLRQEQEDFRVPLKEILDDKGDDKSQKVTSQDFAIRPWATLWSFDFLKSLVPGNDGLDVVLNNFMRWLNIGGSPSWIVSRPPRIQLSPSAAGIEKGETGPICPGISDETDFILRAGIRNAWPMDVPDLLSSHQRIFQQGHPMPILYYMVSDFIFIPDQQPIQLPIFKLRLGLPSPRISNPNAPNKERCGILWDLRAARVDPSYALLPFTIIAMLLPILIAPRMEEVSSDFISHHATPWPAHEERFTAHIDISHIISVHFRAFVAGPEPWFDVDVYGGEILAGLRLDREHASLSLPNGKKFYLSERRYSLVIHASPFSAQPFGEFAIVTLVDDIGYNFQSCSFRRDTGTISRFDLRPCRMLTGVVYFQCSICIMIWDGRQIGIAHFSNWKNLSHQVRDILDEAIVENYMYDDDDLKRSQFYFSLLQLLRIFSEWITRNMDDLKLVAERSVARNEVPSILAACTGGYDAKEDFENAAKIVTRNWDFVLSLHQKKDLYWPIAKLFNAQSVRGTLRNTRINQYLLVFTVVTIIFLPPSFVAFWITFIVVAVVTYIGAITALSGNIQQRKKFRIWLKESLPLIALKALRAPVATFAKIAKKVPPKPVERDSGSEEPAGEGEATTSSKAPVDEQNEDEIIHTEPEGSGANHAGSLFRRQTRESGTDLEMGEIKVGKGKMPERRLP
ncbi:hypothetical protein F4677DRAFT_460836 [Hypoxylon crocopeplum]|nr:hypothetical protein F4677DRAFT_460836 [Hypoxylon crocopeplum]